MNLGTGNQGTDRVPHETTSRVEVVEIYLPPSSIGAISGPDRASMSQGLTF